MNRQVSGRRAGDNIITPGDRQWLRDIGINPKAAESEAFTREYPFASRRALVNGHWLHYVDEGEGEPVVMVHGNPTWSYFYRHLVRGLRDRHRCLAIDHLGCGFSEKPQRYPYNLEHHIANLEGWIDSVLPDGDRFTLVVHDWGGPIGCGFAVRHPERIERLVVLNTSASVRGDMPLRIKLCRPPIIGPALVRGLNAFAGLATRLTTVRPLGKAVRAGFVMPYNNWHNRVAVQRFVDDIPLAPRGPTYACLKDIEDRLPTALKDVPVLVQWGMKDWCFTPYFLGIWRERFPGASVDEYNNAGHYLMEDEGEAIVSRVRQFVGDAQTPA